MDLGVVLVLRRPSFVCARLCGRDKGDEKGKRRSGETTESTQSRRRKKSIGERRGKLFMPSEPQPKRVISTATAPWERVRVLGAGISPAISSLSSSSGKMKSFLDSSFFKSDV